MKASELPEIGIRLSGALNPRRCVELATAAEDAGFASVWFAENPFQRGIMATVGACAAATRHTRMGIGVINPYSRHPVQIAMDVAALDELSDGRVVLGVGSGIAGGMRRMGFDPGRPVAAVSEAIAIIRAMLSGEAVKFNGRLFSVDGVRLDFPARQLPIYMAAGSERALRVCGRVADGLIISNMTPPRLTERLTEIVVEAATKAGKGKPRVVQYVPCTIGLDNATARQAAKTTIGEALALLWPIGDEWLQRREAAVAATDIPRHEFRAALDRLRCGEAAADVLEDRFVDAFAIAGTVEECLQQAAHYRRAGVDELALTFAGAEPVEQMTHLAKAL